MRIPFVLAGLIALALVAAVAYMAGAASNDGDHGPAAPVVATGTSGATGETDAAVPEDSFPGVEVLNGVNLTVYTAGGYGRPSIKADLAELRRLGSTSVTLVPTWYMQTADSNSVTPDSAKSPKDAGLTKAVGWAHEAGLKVVLKPHVDVIDETFRGEIQPGERAFWFQSYEAMINHYADLAAASGVDVFTVGTELKTMSTETDAFRRVIASVRSRFSGPLVYAANWDEVDQVQFWDSLDMIGVDAYYPLASPGQKPTVDQLVEAWQTPLTALKATSDTWGKPVMMTEIGYPTQADAAVTPYEVTPGEPADQQAQAIAYEAAFRAFADQTWLKGMSWWSWRGDPGPDENLEIDYTPQGKKSEAVLAAGQGASR